MNDDTLDYDDMFAGMPPQILQNLYIRYYAMEEYYEMEQDENEFLKNAIEMAKQAKGQPKPAAVKPGAMDEEPEKKKPQEPLKKVAVSMVFNRIIQETIYDLYIMNKLVYSKAKIVVALLSNGREIAVKKNHYWTEFLEDPVFNKLGTAVKLLPQPFQDVLKYAVMSVSNLLLKLGINMSKVSIMPIQKFCSFECLSISTLSVIFLQNLQYRLYMSKKITDEMQQTLFLKQLPKISVIKLCRERSNTDIQTLEAGQYQFFTKQSKKAAVKNLQYLQIHEKSQDPYFPAYERKTPYEHIRQFDLQQISKGTIKSPFTFEVLLFMRYIIFPLVKDFKPDLIVYVESYPADVRVMDEEVRALMLCEMAEETTCNKMYVFKEVGVNKLAVPELQKLYGEYGGEIINEETYKVMEKTEADYFKKYDQKIFMKDDDKREINKMKKILLDDLCYTSLALIQKTSFQSVADKSHQHFYPEEYLKGIMGEQEKLLGIINKEESPGLDKALRSKKDGIKSMLGMLEISQKNDSNIQVINLMKQEAEYFNSFFDLMEGKTQALQTSDIADIRYGEEDHFHVKYFLNGPLEGKLYAIIIRYEGATKCVVMTILSKEKGKEYMNQQKVIELPANQHDLEGATYICSDNYLYRGFGKFRQPASQKKLYNNAIHRFRLYPELGSEWELVGEKSTAIKSDGKQEPNTVMERKKYGYGMWDSQNKNILMMGGYIDTYNEEKISKTIYVIRKADQPTPRKVESLGKTSKLLFMNKFNSQLFLHPFVFGIPFSRNGTFAVNSNGYYSNLSNAGKIFGTLMKLSSVSVMYNGIVSQFRLKVPEDADPASKVILFAELLTKCMVYYCNQVNSLGSICCISTLQQGNVFISLPDDKEEMGEGDKNKMQKRIIVNVPQILEEKVSLSFI